MGWNKRRRHSPELDIVVLEGVYAAGSDGLPQFHELPPPEDADVVRVTALTAGRILRLIDQPATFGTAAAKSAVITPP